MSNLKKQAVDSFIKDPNTESAHKMLVKSVEQYLHLWYQIFYRSLNKLSILQEIFGYDIFISSKHRSTNLKLTGSSKRLETELTNIHTTPFIHKFFTLKRYWQKAPPIATY